MRKLNDLLRALGVGAALAGAPAMQGAAQAAAYDRVVVFGDSLSDTGNAGQRFSNGPLWVERVAAAFGTRVAPALQGGTNYAVGGARLQGPLPSLRAQADIFLAQSQLLAQGNGGAAVRGARTLYVVYGGGNDLRAAVGSPDPRATVDAALRSLRSILNDLIAAGATEILVPNLPNVGRTPETRSRGPNAVAAGAELTRAFNARLEMLLQEVERAHRIRIHRLDVYGILERAAADPRSFGFSNVTEPCAGRAAACPDPDRFLFWDGVHPTAAGHAQLGSEALRALAEQAG